MTFTFQFVLSSVVSKHVLLAMSECFVFIVELTMVAEQTKLSFYLEITCRGLKCNENYGKMEE